MKIAVPREIRADETRVALDPESCRKLIQLGIEVAVEAGAGALAYFPDQAYEDAGATLTADAASLLGGADFVLKVNAPQARPDGTHEVDLMRPGAMLLASIFPTRNLEAVKWMAARPLTAFSTDCIPRTTRAQAMDTLSSQASLVGYRGVLIGALELPKYYPMLMTAAGTTLPAKVFVIGAGVAGLQAIATAKRALEVADRARIAPSVHTVFCARALVESYLRLGRMDDARAAMAGADAYSEETRMPPNVAVPALSRYYALRGDGEGMANLRAKLLAWDNPTMQPMTRAYASFVEAKRLFTMSDDMDAVVAAFADAEAAAGRWPFLMKEILLFRTAVLVLAGRTDEARLHMRRTSRMLDHAPSPWAAAHLLRTEAILLAFQGDWVHGRKLIEAAIATFQMAHDLPDALLARYTRACIDTFHEEPGGREDRDAVEAELLTAGIVPPLAARVGTAVLRDLRRGASLPPTPARVDVESLVVPLKRLAVRGSAPALVLRELFVLARTLVPRRPARLEEVDSNGRSETLHVDSAELPAEVYEWLEFGDGMGRRFRLGVQGPLESEEVSALSVITVTAALVLEVAGLRGLGKSVDGAGKEDASPDIPGLIAVSKAMRRVRAEISQLAGSRATIIVTGESGSGKEVVARAIHDTSARSAKPYVAFNCAAVPRELFEGQLFGYKRGAFTGAVSDHPGVIRAANGGTLFLDEVGELPLDVQPKLLRFLENGEVFPLGDRRAAQVDVRIVAATHRDLAELVKHGRFREDLYYRLQVVPLRIPPLRERKEDILPLARHFLRLLSPETKIPALASDAIEELTAYAWPGNVRELRNVLERALAFAPVPDVLRREHLRI
ncbi:MAG: sigma 54-interacting transcriptional regulator [Polyangiaceae bacterium]|nr:sigma 54-interacting transcriptional regulator [Polyangiaceae bacterium]